MFRRGLVLIACLHACNGSNGSGEVGEVPNTVAGCKEQFSASRGYGYKTDDTPTIASVLSGAGGSRSESQASGILPRRSNSALEQAIWDCRGNATAGTSNALAEAGNAPATGGNSDATVGSDRCDVLLLMTYDAAVCSARAQGLGEGLEGYYAALLFDAGVQRIVWRVRNVTARNQGKKSGNTMVLDAITAEVLASSDWEGTE